MKEIKLLVPADPDFASIIRLTTASICNYLDFNVEEVEDVKVAVSEAFNMLIIQEPIEFHFQIKDKELTIKASIPGQVILYDTGIGANLGRQILSSLVDEVEYKESYILIYKKGMD